MNSQTQTETPVVEIASSNLVNPEDFEAARASAYQSTDPTERHRALTDLVEHAQLAGGTALSDVILEVVSRPNSVTQRAHDELEKTSDAVASLKVADKHDKETYQFVVNNAGEIDDVRRVSLVDEDKTATARSRRVADRVGYGPKQNRSSVVIPDAVPRH